MLQLKPSTKFKKDLRSLKRGNHFKEDELKYVLTKLVNGELLEQKYQNHKLIGGDWDGYWDCHVQNDIVLIYKPDGQNLLLARINTHSELFR